METPPPTAPAGWYPGPDGSKRYWDGQQWLDLPEPEASPETPAAPKPEVPPETSAEPGHTETSALTKSATPWKSKRTLILAGAAVLVIGVGIGGVAWKTSHDAQVAAAAAADQAARDQEAQEDAAAAVKRAKDAADERERKSRAASVKEIEKSIKAMAKKHVKQDVIEGPVISVSCDPVAGGSVDNLTEKTTTFQCFVANKSNKDGTLSGYYYHATMNWDAGTFTYGYGEP